MKQRGETVSREPHKLEIEGSTPSVATTITWEPIDTLAPHPKNRNKHSKEQVDRLAEIIRYQGWRHPIIVDEKSGYIAAGHGRLLAAKQLNLKEVPVHRQAFDSEEQLYAFLVSDNAIASWAELDLKSINIDLGDLGPDFDIDLLGIKDFVLEPADKFQGDEDEVPATHVSAHCKRGELYLLGQHRLLCGDSINPDDVALVMNGERADLCFTSPPYSDLRDYGGNLDLDPKTLAKLFDWPAKIFIVNLGLIIRDREIVPYWDIYLSEAKERGLKLLSWNVWDKEHASAPAHQQAMFGLCHEWIFVFGEYKELNLTKPNKGAGEGYHGNPSVRQKDGSLRITSSKGRTIRTHRQMDSIVGLARQHNYAEDYVGHPAMFPVSLPEQHILAVTSQGGLTADPFLGSGSTLIACEKTNRKCYGMEINPLYCDVILNRWANFTGKDPIREDGVKWSEINGKTS